jgi:hypothetical protein
LGYCFLRRYIQMTSWCLDEAVQCKLAESIDYGDEVSRMLIIVTQQAILELF